MNNYYSDNDLPPNFDPVGAKVLDVYDEPDPDLYFDE